MSFSSNSSMFQCYSPMSPVSTTSIGSSSNHSQTDSGVFSRTNSCDQNSFEFDQRSRPPTKSDQTVISIPEATQAENSDSTQKISPRKGDTSKKTTDPVKLTQLSNILPTVSLKSICVTVYSAFISITVTWLFKSSEALVSIFTLLFTCALVFLALYSRAFCLRLNVNFFKSVDDNEDTMNDRMANYENSVNALKDIV